MFCMECGEKITNEAKFCAKCGAKVELSGFDAPPTTSALTSAPQSSLVVSVVEDKLPAFKINKPVVVKKLLNTKFTIIGVALVATASGGYMIWNKQKPDLNAQLVASNSSPQSPQATALPRNIELIAIDSSDIEAGKADPGHFAKKHTLKALLHNLAPYAQAFPNLELTLKDEQGRPLSYKPIYTFHTEDYLKAGEDVKKGLAANQKLDLRLQIVSGEARISNYQLMAYYPHVASDSSSKNQQDNFDAINDNKGLQGNIKGFIYEEAYENGRRTIVRISSIHLYNATEDSVELENIQIFIGHYTTPGSSDHYEFFEDLASNKLHLAKKINPYEDVTIGLQEDFVIPIRELTNEEFLIFKITDTGGLPWKFASNRIGSKLDYANYRSVTTANGGILTKVVESKNQGGDLVAAYANNLADQIQRVSHPACQSMASLIRRIGNSGQPGDIRQRQVDSTLNQVPPLCLR